ncbi:MAG: phosphoglycolate phosphatase [Methylophilaceae bacterium]
MKFAVKAVMIDLDGTLLHTAPEIAKAANEMLSALNFAPLHLELVESFIGEGAPMLVWRCLTTTLGAAPDADLFDRAERLFFEHYAYIATESKPYSGVEDGLKALSDKGYKLACVTNKPEKFTLPLLKKSGLHDFFKMVVSGDTLAKKKPDPIQLQHICAEFEVLTAEAMLVGDSATDIAAAHAAGCFIVTVPYGYNQGKPLDISKVDATINDLTELTELLE